MESFHPKPEDREITEAAPEMTSVIVDLDGNDPLATDTMQRVESEDGRVWYTGSSSVPR